MEQVETSKKSNIPRLMRGIGTTVLITAALACILQRWSNFDHIERFYSFLSLSGLIAIAGYFCGIKVGDDKGARTLLGVLAVIIPIHFCQLGALLYSKFGNAFKEISGIFLWVAPSTGVALVTTLVGLIFLTPITFIVFSTLARVKAKELSYLFLGLNLALLLPIRDPNTIAIIVFLMMIAVMFADLKIFSTHIAMKTFEGKLARGVMIIPPSLAVARTIKLYDPSAFLNSSLLAIAAIAFLQFFPSYTEDPQSRTTERTAGAGFAMLSWFIAGSKLVDIYLLTGANATLFVCLPLSLILYCISFIEENAKTKYKVCAVTLANISTLCAMLAHPNTYVASLTVVFGIATLVGATALTKASLQYIGAISLFYGLCYHIKIAIEQYAISPWITLGIIGVTVIVCSSVIEKHYSFIKEKIVTRLNTGFKTV